MGIGKRIKEAMERATLLPVDIARHLDISDSAVHQWFAKDTGPKPTRYKALSELLGVSVAWLMDADDIPPIGSTVAGNVNLSASGHLPPLIVWRAAELLGGEAGAWMLKKDDLGSVERGEPLKSAKRAFAVEVQDERNGDVFRPRDMLLINPDRTVLPKDDGLFTGDPEAPDGAASIVGQLVRKTTTEWIIRQYAVKGERRLARLTYPKAWFVAGVYRR